MLAEQYDTGSNITQNKEKAAKFPAKAAQLKYTPLETQKSESKMIKNFENKYGKPNKTILVVGDYDKGDNNMKGKEPTICKKYGN